MLWIIYNLFFPIVFLLMLPKFISRMLRRGGYGRDFGQRIGFFDPAVRIQLAEQPRIWVHAVSVGEIYVALSFMKAYRRAHPHVFFALSTNTSTAYAIGRRELDPRDVLFYFPVDLPLIIRKVLRIVKPVRLVLVEGEYWPNLIRQVAQRGVPIALVNGRMSDRSYTGYRKLRPLMADMLQRIDPICVQGKQDAERLIGLGALPNRVHTVGTVKFDVAERDPVGERQALELLRQIGVPQGAPVLLGGSTWPGEEVILCEIYKKLKVQHPDLFLVLVPRHVERTEEVIRCLTAHQLTYLRRSLVDAENTSVPEVLLVDTTGELVSFYAVADIIFVGKSLTQHGGQNPIEPALCGKAVVVGPNMENFPAVMEIFSEQGALIQVADAEALEQTMIRLLSDPVACRVLGDRARRVVESHRGVIEKTVQLVDEK